MFYFLEIFYLHISFISLICRTIFITIKHPLAIGLILLIQTLLICLITGIISKTFWFSYILFLIFLGGILVLFIYITSLASNEIFNFSSKTFTLNIMIILIWNLIIFIRDKSLLINYYIRYEIESLNFIKRFIIENSLILNKLYNFPVNLITIILIAYLFLTLIAIVKITNIFEGPLRPKN